GPDRRFRSRYHRSRHARGLAPQRMKSCNGFAGGNPVSTFAPAALEPVYMAKSSQDELVFLPLGGSNEIGMNFNCYGFGPPDDRKWIIVDVGVTFGDQTTPGVDIIMPDPSFI